jgi:hypothetical protein
MQPEDQSIDVVQVDAEDQWLDEVLSQTFPASDPVPWGHKEGTQESPRPPSDQREP